MSGDTAATPEFDRVKKPVSAFLRLGLLDKRFSIRYNKFESEKRKTQRQCFDPTPIETSVLFAVLSYLSIKAVSGRRLVALRLAGEIQDDGLMMSWNEI